MEYIRIGKILKTHGLKGEVKVYSYTDFNEERFKKGNTIYFEIENEFLPFVVHSYRLQKGFVYVSFEGYLDINLIEQYKDTYLYFDKAERKALEKGKYYQDDIVGLAVYDENDQYKGKVISIEETVGAQNNMRIQLENGKEVLFPYVDALVIDVNLEKQILHLRWLGGIE
ncbi:MAG: ribosome maturation factor RimM [Solobacterium sp.]|nr:ribosome maturation factor RimM [Solobacterium sp.]